MCSKSKDMAFTFTVHGKAAERLALRLYGFSNAVWPEEWFELPQHHAVEELFEFAFHAYRASELSGLLDLRLDMQPLATSLYKFDDIEEFDWLFDYHYALNRLRHNKSFKFGKANPRKGSAIFANNRNVAAGFFVVSTEQFPNEVAIPFFPLVFTFLDVLRPRLVEFRKANLGG